MKNMVIYLLAVNFITFLLYGDDKSRARRHAWRIPEKVLMGAAVIGGSHWSFTWDEYFSSQNKKTEILYRYSADHAHRNWSGSLGLVYRWTFLSRL